MPNTSHSNAGLGLRRVLMDSLAALDKESAPDFIEVAPENWIGVGGRLGHQFAQLSERYPVYLHGLSLNIGGTAPIDVELVAQIKQFMKRHHCVLYSEHLTYCGDAGHLYDLMPIPFTEEAVRHVADRVTQVQDILGERILLENASYYATLGSELSESQFIRAVLEEADCDLLLDVNNIYVNSINHQYDPVEFLKSLPLERARYIHVAGHYEEAEDLRVDTHGADVIDPVWALLKLAYEHTDVLPTLLERDFNFPPMQELMLEVEQIRTIQTDYPLSNRTEKRLTSTSADNNTASVTHV